ncbi:MAG: metallophosphoesterase [Polyangiaceae bacterium]
MRFGRAVVVAVGVLSWGCADEKVSPLGDSDEGAPDLPIDFIPEAEEPLRFVALGDGGDGGERQFKVAAAMFDVCEKRGGCAFAIYAGDNIYPSGPKSLFDPTFVHAFEEPYKALKMPFYVALGNHDYGGNGSGFDTAVASREVEYTKLSSRWRMPERYWNKLETSPEDGSTLLELFVLDTTYILFTGDDDQQRWLDAAIKKSPATWRIAVGHHPYLSNGRHGSAGAYDGRDASDARSGVWVKGFFEESVCGKVDMYISGHDHDLQWLHKSCDVELVVTGAGAKVSTLAGSTHPTYFQEDELGGFLLVELTHDKLTGTLYDEDGKALFSRVVLKADAPSIVNPSRLGDARSAGQ